MKASDFLKERNQKIFNSYKELRAAKISSSIAKQTISKQYGNLSVSTIDQIIYNKKYSNSPR